MKELADGELTAWLNQPWVSQRTIAELSGVCTPIIRKVARGQRVSRSMLGAIKAVVPQMEELRRRVDAAADATQAGHSAVAAVALRTIQDKEA